MNNPEQNKSLTQQQIDTSLYSSAQGYKQTNRNFDTSPSLIRMFQGNPTQQITTQIRGFDYSGGLNIGNTTSGYMKGNVGGMGQSPRLMDALNSVLNQGGVNGQGGSRINMNELEMDEKCSIHPKEQHIAFDKASGVYGCNKCIFERRVPNPLFLATYARKTKDKFDDLYEKLRFNITQIEDLTPAQISQRIQSMIQDFFQAVYAQMREIERDVLQQVKSSTKLKDLAQIIETLQTQFDEELLQRLETERVVLDDKVHTNRFGYIVVRRQYYEDLIKEMEGFTVELNHKIETSGGLFSQVMNVKLDRLKIYDRLYDLVENCMQINGEKFQRKAAPPAQEINLFQEENKQEQLNGDIESPFKTPQEKKLNGRIDEHGNQQMSQGSEQEAQSVDTFYTLKDKAILKTSLVDGSTKQVHQITHCESTRVAYTQKGRVFLIGGSRGPMNNETLKNTYELVPSKASSSKRRRSSQNQQNELALEERASMMSPRTSFGCVVDNYGSTIYALGGSIHQQEATDLCEYYSIDTNKWTELPAMNQKKLSTSACLFNDTWLFVFSGYDSNFNLLSSIERLKLDDPIAKWEVLPVQCPSVSSAGAFQFNNQEIVVFGGFNEYDQTQAFFLKQDNSGANFEVFQEDECKLETPDTFLFTGALKIDTEKNEITIAGQNYIHKFNDKVRGFDLVREIQPQI